MKPTIIGLYGEAGAGKDAVANFLLERAHLDEYKTGRFSFAAPVYALAAVILSTTPEKLARRRFKEVPQWFLITNTSLEAARDLFNKYGLDRYEEFSDVWPIFEEKYIRSYERTWEEDSLNPESDRSVYISPRRMLQLVGTEFGREMLNENVWLTTLLNEINKVAPDVAVVTDVRFPNELSFIAESNDEDVDSYVLEIQRPHNPDRTESKHKSEQRLDSTKIKEVILNDGSLEELQSKVIAFCDKEFN